MKGARNGEQREGGITTAPSLKGPCADSLPVTTERQGPQNGGQRAGDRQVLAEAEPDQQRGAGTAASRDNAHCLRAGSRRRHRWRGVSGPRCSEAATRAGVAYGCRSRDFQPHACVEIVMHRPSCSRPVQLREVWLGPRACGGR
jgi:hypothetical protein